MLDTSLWKAQHTAMPNELKVENNEKAHRFQTEIDGWRAFIQYRKDADQIVYLHTEVPEALEGQGIGSRLAKTALEYARDHHLKVVPLCPFVAAYIRRHAEYAELVAS